MRFWHGEKMSEWKSEKLSDLLQAHQVLMMGLVDNPGQLRSGNVGVYRGLFIWPRRSHKFFA